MSDRRNPDKSHDRKGKGKASWTDEELRRRYRHFMEGESTEDKAEEETEEETKRETEDEFLASICHLWDKDKDEEEEEDDEDDSDKNDDDEDEDDEIEEEDGEEDGEEDREGDRQGDGEGDEEEGEDRDGDGDQAAGDDDGDGDGGQVNRPARNSDTSNNPAGSREPDETGFRFDRANSTTSDENTITPLNLDARRENYIRRANELWNLIHQEYNDLRDDIRNYPSHFSLTRADITRRANLFMRI